MSKDLSQRRFTLRRKVKNNYKRFRDRYRIVTKYLAKSELTEKTDYWWAKVCRKAQLLQRLCDELQHQPMPECDTCYANLMRRNQGGSHGERATAIMEKVSEAMGKLEEYRQHFDHINIDDYAYGDKSPRQAAREDKSKKRMIREIATRKMEYFRVF